MSSLRSTASSLNAASGIFFPSFNIVALGRANSSPPAFTFHPRPDGRLEVQWGGLAYAVHQDGRSLSEDQVLLVAAISNVLAARYSNLFNASSNATSFSLFNGTPEDHYVSAYLDSTPFVEADAFSTGRDRISDAIESAADRLAHDVREPARLHRRAAAWVRSPAPASGSGSLREPIDRHQELPPFERRIANRVRRESRWEPGGSG